MMFQVSNLYNTEDKLILVPQNVLNCLDEECKYYGCNCDKDVQELCKEIILENRYNSNVNDPYDGVKLYINLRAKIYDLLA